MSIIRSSISTSSTTFKENETRYRELIVQLHRQRDLAFNGAEPKVKERHLGAGKLLPRDRVRALLDPGSPFLEVSTLAGGGASACTAFPDTGVSGTRKNRRG